jgi:lipopolysaccharide O-acetyltransferase
MSSIKNSKSIFLKIYSLGFLGLFRLLRDVIVSVFILDLTSIIRWPFYIRRFGKLHIGRNFRVGPGAVIEILDKNATLKIGHSFRASSRLHIGCVSQVIIGNNVLIASDVYISDHSHGCYEGIEQSDSESIVNSRDLYAAPIIISDNVWIGEKVCILPGVTIGRNSIVGALSVVKNDIMPDSIYVGCPARRIKVYDRCSKSWVKVDD